MMTDTHEFHRLFITVLKQTGAELIPVLGEADVQYVEKCIDAHVVGNLTRLKAWLCIESKHINFLHRNML